MAQIILDFGSGNTCKNETQYVKRMIDELKSVDTKKHEVIIKWQLFDIAGDNVPLKHEVFEYAYFYAKSLGYKTTSSVFDYFSLKYLLEWDVPFVKIANNRSLDYLIGEIPRKMPIYISVGNVVEHTRLHHKLSNIDVIMSCISNYPATISDYTNRFDYFQLRNISDHTTSFEIFNIIKPAIIEWHYGLSDSTGLDAGEFMKTPQQLSSIL